MIAKREKKINKVVVGLDEAGRGAWAGPVATAAVSVADHRILDELVLSFLSYSNLKNKDVLLRDSKLLSPKKRDEIFEIITNNSNINWSVSFIDSKTIDEINIWQATVLGWKKCLDKLPCRPDLVLVDGHMTIPNLTIKQKPVINGDTKIAVISLASIIAKVSRDRFMQKMDEKYVNYGFDRHKGYGVKLHQERLVVYGPCDIHRKSFKPIANIIEQYDSN
ncbi:MAG: ribonuclease HII [bacterium]